MEGIRREIVFDAGVYENDGLFTEGDFLLKTKIYSVL